MPGMSGIQLKRFLTAQGIEAPVIMITARADPELADDALSSGAICLLRKPFDVGELLRVVARFYRP